MKLDTMNNVADESLPVIFLRIIFCYKIIVDFLLNIGETRYACPRF